VVTDHTPAVTEVEGLDEAQIAADAARMAAALAAATTVITARPAPPLVSRRTAQERFDVDGLPRGLTSLDAL
jgi:hypothetical protein